MAVKHKFRVRKESGPFHHDSGVIQPGETFIEYPHRVFRLARHFIDEGPIEPYPEPAAVNVQPRDDGTVDIIHGVTGKPINSRPLTPQEAEPMLRLLRKRMPTPDPIPDPPGTSEAA